MNRIMVVEDEQSVRRSVEFALSREGYEIRSCGTVKDAGKIMKEFEPEIILCDLDLPDGSGLEFIESIRKNTEAYIICLTALDRETDMVMGYESGADDYVTKPFSLSVLIMKINACSRREKMHEKQILRSGNITADIGAMKAYCDDVEISLTKNEWKLLMLFMENPDIILSKERILEKIFDVDSEFVDENTVAVNIARLRKKLNQDSDGRKLIKNVRGLGYVWNTRE